MRGARPARADAGLKPAADMRGGGPAALAPQLPDKLCSAERLMIDLARKSLADRISGLTAIPTVPTTLLPLLHLLELPADEWDMKRITDLISCDPSLAAQCLRMANSPLFGRSRTITTIHAAIITIGTGRLWDLLTAFCLMDVIPTDKWAMDPLAFWEHSFGCALISRHLAQLIGFPQPDKAYAGGLLHDIGEIVNSMLFADDFRAAADLSAAEEMPLHEAEQQVLGFSHTEAGRVLAEHWHLPDDLVQVIQCHHHGVKPAPEFASLVMIISLGDLLCRARGMDYGYFDPAQVDFVSDPAWIYLVRNYPRLRELDLVKLSSELDEYATEAKRLTAAVFRSKPEE